MALVQQAEFSSKLRCARCDRVFHTTDAQPCFYHSGQLREVSGSFWYTTKAWDCCSRLGADARGCQRAMCHEPHAATRAALAQFPITSEACATVDKGVCSLEAKKTDVAASAGRGMHIVSIGESLASIALSHGTSTPTLRKLNSLLSSNVYPGQMLRLTNDVVVKGESETLAENQRSFRRQTRCLAVEASLYLDLADGNLSKAMDLWRADTAWESSDKTKGIDGAHEAAAPGRTYMAPGSAGAPVELRSPVAACKTSEAAEVF